MGDYNYMFGGCLELTVEVSCDKRPPGKTLTRHWTDNCPALLAVLGAVEGGIRGVVRWISCCFILNWIIFQGRAGPGTCRGQGGGG